MSVVKFGVTSCNLCLAIDRYSTACRVEFSLNCKPAYAVAQFDLYSVYNIMKVFENGFSKNRSLLTFECVVKEEVLMSA